MKVKAQVEAFSYEISKKSQGEEVARSTGILANGQSLEAHSKGQVLHFHGEDSVRVHFTRFFAS